MQSSVQRLPTIALDQTAPHNFSVCKALRQTTGFATFQHETTVSVPQLFNSLYSAPKNLLSMPQPSTPPFHVVLLLQYVHVQKSALKPLPKADWKLDIVFNRSLQDQY